MLTTPPFADPLPELGLGDAGEEVAPEDAAPDGRGEATTPVEELGPVGAGDADALGDLGVGEVASIDVVADAVGEEEVAAGHGRAPGGRGERGSEWIASSAVTVVQHRASGKAACD